MTKDPQTSHLVLARKYRPQDFSSLYGQEALVRTLTNALTSGRIAQAYMLTGVRGVGKTTTARIIARALNCIGEDGEGGPTPTPCGVCANCQAIAADRHPDVLEMDAASRTGVGDIRELIDSVRYAPVQARFKVYIIDEVHMLSKQAFNALLKTLEEPPQHVKFIFATTEIRQVPVTILSRCQRFDLRRIQAEELQDLFTKVLGSEKVEAEEEAIKLIARAADGSARDGLSLLDQAIALSTQGVEAETVRSMLGQADRSQLIDLFQAILAGKATEVLDIFDAMYNTGAEPLLVVRDLSALSHLLTRTKVAPKATEKQDLPELERKLIDTTLDQLHIGILGRLWQALQQGQATMERAQDTKQAGDMVLMRLCHMANVPTPGETLKQLQSQQAPASGGGSKQMVSTASASPTAKVETAPQEAVPIATPSQEKAATKVDLQDPDPNQPPVSTHAPVSDTASQVLGSFKALVAFMNDKKEIRLAHDLRTNVRLVAMDSQAKLLQLQLLDRAPDDMIRQVRDALHQHRGENWQVEESDQPAEPTLKDQERQEQEALMQAAATHPLVAATLASFPESKLIRVTPKTVQ